MLKIGIYLDLKNDAHLNFKSVKHSNPGVGGTEYLVVLLATLLSEIEKYSITVYVKNRHDFHENIIQKEVLNENDAMFRAHTDKMDLFIFAVKKYRNDFYESIDTYKLPTIAWVHNYISHDIIDQLHHTEYIKKIVFVGQQHYDAYIDDKIINKSTFIFNMVPTSSLPRKYNSSGSKIVTYVGALEKSKGFRILAKNWKKVVYKVPEAKLYVIGSGKLYNKSAKLGAYELADEKYEKSFIKYLIDEDGNLIDSVKFFGTLGQEKEEILNITSVGVANPSGKTETFCLSAVEFETHGIPVVSYKGFGLLDTIENKESGLLSKNPFKISKSIIYLLQNSEANLTMGKNGIVYSKKKFSPDSIISQWEGLIVDTLNDEPTSNLFSYKYLYDDWKWLKLFFYKLKITLKINKLPSFEYIKSKIKSKIKGVLS